MPRTSSGLRSGRGHNSEMGGGGGELAFKHGFPSEEADNKGAGKVWELRRGRWRGEVGEVRWICQVDSSTQSFILAMT